MAAALRHPARGVVTLKLVHDARATDPELPSSESPMTDHERAVLEQEKSDLAIHVEMAGYRWRLMQKQFKDWDEKIDERLTAQDKLLRRILTVLLAIGTAMLTYLAPHLLPLLAPIRAAAAHAMRLF